MQLISNKQRGDTIIEVLFAVAVFAVVAVGSMAIMNQGTATAQRSLEVTQVRQQIDAQAEAIRYIHQAYVASYQQGGTPAGTAAQWTAMTNPTTGKGATGASNFNQLASGASCPTTVPGEKPFILNARLATIANIAPTMAPPANASLPPFAHIIYNTDSSINSVYGLWIESVPSVRSDGPGFVDFHIRACWSGPGSTIPITLGTIVRLYEPR